MKSSLFAAAVISLFTISCQQNGTDKIKQEENKSTDNGTLLKTAVDSSIAKADTATIMARPQIPVLCYHHIREFKPGESDRMKSYSVTPAAFAEQMKALYDSGYNTILPDELYEYLVYGKKLPEKSVMITFDDTDLEQYTLGAAEMKKYGFKGVYFIMTIAIGKPRYMSKEQIRELADDGHVIACHTWDHHMVTKYNEEDWQKQLVETRNKLEDITGKKVTYFAYPFGIYNHASSVKIRELGYKMAFILSTKRDASEPLHTVRRMIVPGTWSTKGMLNAMRSTFSNSK